MAADIARKHQTKTIDNKPTEKGLETGGCLFTQSHADHVIGLPDERSLYIDKGQSVLDTGTCVLKASGVCAPPQVRKLYK